jgi:hypothetical protein
MKSPYNIHTSNTKRSDKHLGMGIFMIASKPETRRRVMEKNKKIYRLRGR